MMITALLAHAGDAGVSWPDVAFIGVLVLGAVAITWLLRDH